MVSLEVVAILLSGISISVSMFYYANVLANTNKTRQTQLFMQTYQRVVSVEFQQHVSELIEWKWTDFDAFNEKYFSDIKERGKFISIMVFYDGLGVLLKENYIEPEMLFHLEQGGTRGATLVWFRFKSIFIEMRKRENNPDLLKHLEYYVEELIRMRKLKDLPSGWSPDNVWFFEEQHNR